MDCRIQDFKTFTKRKSILYTIIYFELIISIGLPFLMRFVASRNTKVPAASILPTLLDAFSFLYALALA